MNASPAELLAAVESGFGYLHPNTLSGALVLLVLHLAAGRLLSSLLVRGIQGVLEQDKSERVDRLTAAFLAQLARVFVWLFVLTAYAHLIPALNRLATAMLASVSIASVVFGLAAQSTLANLIAGVSLIFYKPFRMGDELQITAPTGVETGVVEQMSLGHTTLRTIDDRRVVISNATMLSQVIINLGAAQSRRQVAVPFTAGANVDRQHLCALLTDVAKANADVVEFVSCTITDITSDTISMTLIVRVRDAAAVRQAESELLDAIRTTLARSDLGSGDKNDAAPDSAEGV